MESQNHTLADIQLNVATILVKKKRAETLRHLDRKRERCQFDCGADFSAVSMISFGSRRTCSHASIFAFVMSM